MLFIHFFHFSWALCQPGALIMKQGSIMMIVPDGTSSCHQISENLCFNKEFLSLYGSFIPPLSGEYRIDIEAIETTNNEKIDHILYFNDSSIFGTKSNPAYFSMTLKKGYRYKILAESRLEITAGQIELFFTYTNIQSHNKYLYEKIQKEYANTCYTTDCADDHYSMENDCVASTTAFSPSNVLSHQLTQSLMSAYPVSNKFKTMSFLSGYGAGIGVSIIIVVIITIFILKRRKITEAVKETSLSNDEYIIESIDSTNTSINLDNLDTTTDKMDTFVPEEVQDIFGEDPFSKYKLY
ncbi:hypothetical protein TRFO_30926 [Tritrichomonas foetus]|uniref:Uncharacterized protein n=1 Tax=Tritrichomonas foetus TaxID=1144522 RepID=A0A1J4JXP5_9EUKA|nr:hypothetical protein TRFO_30926 [Tritrichomonas foetus]|eukprot:OHT02053.1 hypothetical protein TRFO_30926 [Tritrichomonas foetus]